jgi:hypothetical protein
MPFDNTLTLRLAEQTQRRGDTTVQAHLIQAEMKVLAHPLGAPHGRVLYINQNAVTWPSRDRP